MYDLEIIIRECRNREEFIGYLMFRKTNSQILLSIDELDVFGLYQKNGNVKIDIDTVQLMTMNFSQKYDRKYYFENVKWIRNYNVVYHY